MVDADEISSAARALTEGKLVIMPTETVYGLAADAANAEAVTRLFRAKGRPAFNPLIVHVASLAAAERVARFDARAQRLAKRFWPGPLTLVLPALAKPAGNPVCDAARAGLDTVAVRWAAHGVAQALLEAFGGPVVAPSANRSGRPSPTTFRDACDESGASAGVALDGGDCLVGLESTVVSALDGPLRLLRSGALDRKDLEAAGEVIGDDGDANAHRSPGRLARHYAPQAPMRLNALSPEPGEAFLAFGPTPPGPNVWTLSASENLAEAAHNLFAHLRAADRTTPRAIAVASIPMRGLGEAINDRLRRAAGYVG